jgi:hypothetical protein
VIPLPSAVVDERVPGRVEGGGAERVVEPGDELAAACRSGVKLEPDRAESERRRATAGG